MKRGNRSHGRKSSPKQSLNVPHLDQAKSAVLKSLPSKESQRGYQHAIDEFIARYRSEPRLSFNKAVVTRYRIHPESRQLAPGTINGKLAAVRRLAYDLETLYWLPKALQRATARPAYFLHMAGSASIFTKRPPTTERA